MTNPASIVADYIGKAERALEEARWLLRGDKTEGTCSRAYYAMHDAAHAALFVTGNETPETIIKTHRTLIAEFGRKLVLGGQIDANLGRALNRVQDIRLLADYDATPPSLTDAAWCVEQAEAFVVAVRGLIAGLKA